MLYFAVAYWRRLLLIVDNCEHVLDAAADMVEAILARGSRVQVLATSREGLRVPASSALIFPSRTESFGLPLIEAMHHGLPILAPELDYVRDVVTPIETFDPSSPISIARAVRRFLGNAEPTAQIHSAEDFLLEVLK